MKFFLLGARPLFVAGLIAGAVLGTMSGSAWSKPAAVWQPLGEDIVRIIDEAENQYRTGNVKAAQRAVVEAYFGVFENRKMEAAMRITIGAKHTYLVEKRFGALRKAIKNSESPDKIRAIAAGIRAAVRKDAKILDDAQVTADVFEVTP